MKKHLILTATLAALLITAGCSDPAAQDQADGTKPQVLISASPTAAPSADPQSAPSGGFSIISTGEAVEMMQRESGYIILDVRTIEEFDELHITGALNLPNEDIGTEELPLLPDKDQLIMVYCRSGNRSKEASAKLVELGYTNIVEFGGIIDWTGPVEGRAAQH